MDEGETGSFWRNMNLRYFQHTCITILQGGGARRGETLATLCSARDLSSPSHVSHYPVQFQPRCFYDACVGMCVCVRARECMLVPDLCCFLSQARRDVVRWSALLVRRRGEPRPRYTTLYHDACSGERAWKRPPKIPAAFPALPPAFPRLLRLFGLYLDQSLSELYNEGRFAIVEQGLDDYILSSGEPESRCRN